MQERLENLGESIDTGTVVELLVKAGDKVEKGQTLLELESEKAVVPIPATHSGVVKELLVKAGDILNVGQVILNYDGGDSQESTSATVRTRTAPESNEAPDPLKVSPARPSIVATPEISVLPQSASGPQPTASPTVKRITHQLEIDLRWVPSASPGGRVELSDLKYWLHSLVNQVSQANPEVAKNPAKPKSVSVPFEKWGPIRRERLSEIRRTISRHMVESKNAQPHVTQFESVDITDLEAARKSQAAQWKEAGIPLTLTGVAVLACVKALQKHPIFNASIDESSQEIVYKDYFHIGIATDTKHGLMVPVIHNADKKSLLEISTAIPQLAEKARSRKLGKEAMSGGTFTISNQGGIGGGHFTPVINRPESAILGIGRSQWQPAVVGDGILPRLILPLTVSYDHRIIDGGTAVHFTLDLISALKSFTVNKLKFQEA